MNRRSFLDRWKARAKTWAIVLAAILVLAGVVDEIIMPLYTQQGRTTVVPDLLGLPVEQALGLLRKQGLEGKTAEVREDKRYPEGTVAAQNPPFGSVVKFGRGVYITVSGGAPLISVPALRGRSLRDATLTLEQLGLKVGDLRYQVSQDFPENTIVEQSLPEGEQVVSRTPVSLVVSQGPSADRLPIPSVVRTSLSEAERIVLTAGFTIGNISYQVNLELLPNTVIDQYPRPGGFASRGRAIDLFVAQKPDTVTPAEE